MRHCYKDIVANWFKWCVEQHELWKYEIWLKENMADEFNDWNDDSKDSAGEIWGCLIMLIT